MAYIDREKIVKDIESKRLVIDTTKTTVAEALRIQGKAIREAIENAPTADVAEVKHSMWKLYDDGSGCCKICNYHQKAVWDMDGWQEYCGHCGAKMDGERRTDDGLY